MVTLNFFLLLISMMLSSSSATKDQQLTEEDVLKKDFKPSGDLDDPETHGSRLDYEQQVEQQQQQQHVK
jgi:hypothetical protein